MKLALGVVASHGFPIPVEFFLRYNEMALAIANGSVNQQLRHSDPITEVALLASQSFPVDVARNEIVRKFLASHYDALLFLDCDMRHPIDLAARLLDHERPVITARYHMRREPFNAVVYVKHPTLEGPHAYQPVHFGQGVFEIERGGAGALLIQREVLEAIRERIGDNWFRYQRGPDTGDFTVSEDFWFYQQAREAGFKCYVDWDTVCTHFAQIEVGPQHAMTYLQAQLEVLPRLNLFERERILNAFVVCGYPAGIDLGDGTVLPEYIVTPGER